MPGSDHPRALFLRQLMTAPAAVKSWLTGRNDTLIAQRMAGNAFLIRVASAGLVFLAQVFLARWMGRFEFGVYVYVWTWVLLIGDTIHLGLPLAAQRYIPEYTKLGMFDLLRGFLEGSRSLVISIAAATGILGIVALNLLKPWLNSYEFVPFVFACLCLPFYSLSNMLDGIARTYNWINLALLPPYFLRPLILISLMVLADFAGFEADATTALAAAFFSCWATALVQLFILDKRLVKEVPAGPKAYAIRSWFGTALPIILVWGFFTLLTYTDVLMLQFFRPPDEVALYYAATKTLALVAFVYFSVAASAAHRFTEFHVGNDHAGLEAFVAKTVHWTFWPSLAAAVVILALGRPFLWLFGPHYVGGYHLMFILVVGLLARSSVGPAERLLNMLGEQRMCAMVYATAFFTNVIVCLLLIPPFGVTGAAIATASALVVESTLLFVVTKRRLGLHIFIWRPAGAR